MSKKVIPQEMSTSERPSPYKKVQITPQRWTSPNPERREYHCKQRKETGWCGCIKAKYTQKCQSCGNWINGDKEERGRGDCITTLESGWSHVECNDNEEFRGLPSIRKQYNSVHHGNLLRIEAGNESEPATLLADDQSTDTPLLTREALRIVSPPSKRQRNNSEDEECSEIVPHKLFDTQGQEISKDYFESSDDEAPNVRETEEQKRILEHEARYGDVVCVNALAGCGKTTTISLLCNKFASRNYSVLYLVFGKKNQDEAKNSNKFPRDNMEIRTTHSFVLAHYFGKEQMHNVKSIDKYDLQDIIDKTDLFTECKAIFPKLEEDRYRKRLKRIAAFIRKTIEKFQSSDKEKVSKEHVYWRATKVGNRSEWKKLVNQKRYANWAQTYFDSVHLECQEMKNGSLSSIKVPFDAYMKVAQLDKLKIDANVVLIDEAQDMTPCQGKLFWGPEQREGKIIYLFGDRHQQLYRFRGASDSFSNMVNTSEPCLSLTGSFRFGKNIARYANYILTQIGSDELKGRAKKHGQILQAPKVMNEECEGMVVLCRTNLGIFHYLLENEPKRWCSIGNTFVPPTQLKPWVFKLEDFINGKTVDFSYNSECFNSIFDLEEFAVDQGDSVLMRFIALLQLLKDKDKPLADFVEKIRQSHSRIEDDESPDDYRGIIMGTVHKAKGLEFKKVLLHEDFKFHLMRSYLRGHGHPAAFTTDEANILYVAVTRAKEFLYLSPEAEDFFEWLRVEEEEGKPKEFIDKDTEKDKRNVIPDIDCTKERETLFELFKKFKSETTPILSLEDIPWPNLVSLGLDRKMSELDHRRHIRALLLRYYPDKFFPSFGCRIEDRELFDEVKARLGEIFMLCNALGEFATLNDV